MSASRAVIISPSILAADFTNLGAECEKMLQLGADTLHVDVMDGHFVPNITFGPSVVQSLSRRLPASAFLDCHLMVANPKAWLGQFVAAGARSVTFHVEAAVEAGDDPAALIDALHQLGCRAGLAIKPRTPASAVKDEWLQRLDMLLVMTVEPGFGGQAFMADQLERVADFRRRAPATLDIQVDGGLNLDNVAAAKAAGANVIVAGSSIFNAPDPGHVISAMRSA